MTADGENLTWTKGGVVLAAIAIVASISTPEIRRLVGLEAPPIPMSLAAPLQKTEPSSSLSKRLAAPVVLTPGVPMELFPGLFATYSPSSDPQYGVKSESGGAIWRAARPASLRLDGEDLAEPQRVDIYPGSVIRYRGTRLMAVFIVDEVESQRATLK
jgi:hypothetical protein